MQCTGYIRLEKCPTVISSSLVDEFSDLIGQEAVFYDKIFVWGAPNLWTKNRGKNKMLKNQLQDLLTSERNSRYSINGKMGFLNGFCLWLQQPKLKCFSWSTGSNVLWLRDLNIRYLVKHKHLYFFLMFGYYFDLVWKFVHGNLLTVRDYELSKSSSYV